MGAGKESGSGGAGGLMATRTIKVGHRFYGDGCDSREMVRVPFIRLSGKWLEEIGFAEGDSIEVVASAGEIKLVRKAPPTAQYQKLLL